jgi:RND family efflux transporter MFP subunit
VSRRSRWIVAALALLLLTGFIARALIARSAETAARAVVPVAQALELAATDVATATRTDLVAAIAVSGGLKAVDSAVLKARVAAEVRQLLVREGDSVKAGQLLGRLDDTEFALRLRQAEDQARAAQAQLDIAERTLANNRALVDQGFISKNALDTAVSSADSARASLQAARAASDLTRKAVRDTEIRAPLSGLVAQRFVQPGERVPLDGKLLEIVDLSKLELEAAIAPEDVTGLRVGQTARLQVDGVPEALTARVARINPSAQAGTRAVLAYLAVEPLAGLRQGLFARGRIELQRQSALVVPASAVRYDQARPYVLVVEGGKAVRRSVSLGALGEVVLAGVPEEGVAITDGLAEGATVLRGSVGAVREGTLLRLALPAANGASVAAAVR